MPSYFIIDQAHCLRVQTGPDKATVKDAFNDRHTSKVDLCIAAEKCQVHSKYLAPDLPAWMEYSTPGNLYFCTACEAALYPVLHHELQTPTIELVDAFFTHAKGRLF